MTFVIVRTDNGMYATPPRSLRPFTHYLMDARKFDTFEEATKALGKNETIREIR
jgi:hypothetical protein